MEERNLLSVASKNTVKQMEKSKGDIDNVYFAKLAEQAERYDEMAEHMKFRALRQAGRAGGALRRDGRATFTSPSWPSRRSATTRCQST